MKIKFTLLLFLLLVTFSAIANYNLPKEKLKKVKLQLNYCCPIKPENSDSPLARACA